ncbi:MAG: GyrI-like domain-containing protein [Pyrinomonadaceae bacterium]
MFPDIKTTGEIKLIGMRERMSFAENRTFELWREFMPRRFEVENALPNRLYSVQIYDIAPYSEKFNMHTEFEKWAAVEVSEFIQTPEGMETHILSGGEYAVFDYKGTPEMFHKTAQYIFLEWLPASGFELDAREHFEILGEKYLGSNNPESEEEIWIPVKRV